MNGNSGCQDSPPLNTNIRQMSGMNGNSGCPCADPLLTATHAMEACANGETTDCCDLASGGRHEAWGSCLSALVGIGNTQPYPPTYGSQCQKHDEFGNEECFSQTTGLEHGIGIRTGCDDVFAIDDPWCYVDRAGWCDDPWCYVDACVCNSEVTQSEYFVGQSISYSYATCGAADAFALTVTGGTQQAVCDNLPVVTTTTTTTSTSDSAVSAAGHESPGLNMTVFAVGLIVALRVLFRA